MSLWQDFFLTWLVAMLLTGSFFLFFSLPDAFLALWFLSGGILMGYVTAKNRYER